MPGLTLTITVWVVSTAGSFGVAQMVSYELSTKITCDVAAAVVCHVIVATPADVALPCTFDIDNPVCAWPGMAASPMSKAVVAPLNSASDSCERSDMNTSLPLTVPYRPEWHLFGAVRQISVVLGALT